MAYRHFSGESRYGMSDFGPRKNSPKHRSLSRSFTLRQLTLHNHHHRCIHELPQYAVPALRVHPHPLAPS